MTKTVLLVDDEDTLRRGLRRRFEREGFIVHEARDSTSATTMLQTHRTSIDVVVTDLCMEDENAGNRFIDTIARLDRRPLVGVYTAHGDLADFTTKSTGNLVDFYLSKSNDPTPLVRQVLRSLPGDRILSISAYEPWRRVPLPVETAARSRFRVIAAEDTSTSPIAGMTPVRATVVFEMGPLEVRNVTTQEGVFHEIRSDRLIPAGRPGEPGVLQAFQRVALRAPSVEVEARLVEEHWVEAGETYSLMPHPVRDIEGHPDSYRMSGAAYREDIAVPLAAVDVSDKTHQIDGVHFVPLRLRPVRYNGRTCKLEVLVRAVAQIDGLVEDSSPSVDAPEGHDEQDGPESSPLADLFIGPSPAPEESASAEASAGDQKTSHPEKPSPRRRRYIVVCAPEAVDALEPLIRERQRDFDVTVAVLGREIPITPDKPSVRRRAIHNFLKKESSKVGAVRFVLLVGDGTVIPYYHRDQYEYERLHGAVANAAIRGIPVLSDVWYATFDEDGSNVPRYALGRLPFAGSDEVSRYCARFYGEAASTAFRGWSFLIGADSASATNRYKEHVEGVLVQYQGTPHLDSARVCPGAEHPTPSEAIDTGPSLVTYRGHGRRTNWAMDPVLDAAFVRGRPDTFVAGVLSVACCTAALDAPKPALPQNPGCGKCVSHVVCSKDEPFGSTWLAQGIAPWFIGSSRKSFHSANNVFNGSFMEAVVGGETNVGGAFRRALAGLVAVDADGSAEDNLRMLMLLGDPAWPLPKPGT
jgi:CheY-like chemotaxis protein